MILIGGIIVCTLQAFGNFAMKKKHTHSTPSLFLYLLYYDEACNELAVPVSATVKLK